MSRSQLDYLQHILDEIEYLVKETHGLSKEKFIQDQTLKRAFVRSLEIIGEAAKNLSLELRTKYSDIEWRGMAGMRDKLIHHYFGIDYDIVWDVISNYVPTLQQKIRQIMEDEKI